MNCFPALQYKGGNMLIHNSEFVYNDWVGLGNLATVYGDDVGTPGEFSQNTMFNNGESVDVRSTGKVYKNVLMNDIQVTNSWHDDISSYSSNKP